MRVLIVDDNDHVRALARVYAEQAGATEIVDVNDGGAALTAVDRWVEQQERAGGNDPAAPGLVSRTVDALLGVAL